MSWNRLSMEWPFLSNEILFWCCFSNKILFEVYKPCNIMRALRHYTCIRLLFQGHIVLNLTFFINFCKARKASTCNKVEMITFSFAILWFNLKAPSHDKRNFRIKVVLENTNWRVNGANCFVTFATLTYAKFSLPTQKTNLYLSWNHALKSRNSNLISRKTIKEITSRALRHRFIRRYQHLLILYLLFVVMHRSREYFLLLSLWCPCTSE